MTAHAAHRARSTPCIVGMGRTGLSVRAPPAARRLSASRSPTAARRRRSSPASQALGAACVTRTGGFDARAARAGRHRRGVAGSAARRSVLRAGARARPRRRRRHRAVRARRGRAGGRHHRHQRQEHRDDAGWRAWPSAPACAVRVGGNLGQPALDLLRSRTRPISTCSSCRRSSSRPRTRSSCKAAVVLNVTAGPHGPLRDAAALRRCEGAHLRALRHGGGERSTSPRSCACRAPGSA